MSRLKRKKTSYDPRDTAFLFEVEKIAVKEGFTELKPFIRHYINRGFTFVSFQKYLEENYGLTVSKGCFYNHIRPLTPYTYNRQSIGHYKRRAIISKNGQLKSVNNHIKIHFLRGYGKVEIAKLFKTTTLVLTKNKHIYPFDFSGNSFFPDKVKLGMKDFKDYYRWLENTRKFGFESVVEAIEYLIVEKNLSMRDTAWVFQVTTWRLRVRISKCMYLREKLNLSSKKGRKKNGTKTSCGTNV